jgi:hypothetical protein
VTDAIPDAALELDAIGGEETAAPAAAGLDALDEQLIDRLAGRARDGGLQLAGEGGLLAQLTKRLLESALEGELADHLGYDKADHLGYDKHDVAGRDGGNSRNGHGPRRCSPMSARLRSRCRATGRAASSRRSWPSGRNGCPGWTSWSSRCRRRG